MSPSPAALRLTAAYLEFTTDETSAGSADLRIEVEASGDAAPITSTASGISSRPKAAALRWQPGDWNRVGATHTTPNLKSLAQAVINRDDWRSGNALLFAISGSGARTAESYNGNPAAAARLTIEYTSGTTTTPPTGSNVSLPARAAFYYPWFPETWTVNGSHVAYQPLSGYYDSGDRNVVDRHIEAMDYAKIDVAIFSWWGIDTHKETTRIPQLLSRTRAAKFGPEMGCLLRARGVRRSRR